MQRSFESWTVKEAKKLKKKTVLTVRHFNITLLNFNLIIMRSRNTYRCGRTYVRTFHPSMLISVLYLQPKYIQTNILTTIKCLF